MPPLNSALAKPGIVSVQVYGGARQPVGECARCELKQLLHGRGLCHGCYRRVCDAGELDEWGWTKTDKIVAFAAARALGQTIIAASRAAEVSTRQGQRYEQELALLELAPWRATDVNVQYAARRMGRP